MLISKSDHHLHMPAVSLMHSSWARRARLGKRMTGWTLIACVFETSGHNRWLQIIFFRTKRTALTSLNVVLYYRLFMEGLSRSQIPFGIMYHVLSVQIVVCKACTLICIGLSVCDVDKMLQHLSNVLFFKYCAGRTVGMIYLSEAGMQKKEMAINRSIPVLLLYISRCPPKVATQLQYRRAASSTANHQNFCLIHWEQHPVLSDWLLWFLLEAVSSPYWGQVWEKWTAAASTHLPSEKMTSLIEVQRMSAENVEKLHMIEKSKAFFKSWHQLLRQRHVEIKEPHEERHKLWYTTTHLSSWITLELLKVFVLHIYLSLTLTGLLLNQPQPCSILLSTDKDVPSCHRAYASFPVPFYLSPEYPFPPPHSSSAGFQAFP